MSFIFNLFFQKTLFASSQLDIFGEKQVRKCIVKQTKMNYLYYVLLLKVKLIHIMKFRHFSLGFNLTRFQFELDIHILYDLCGKENITEYLKENITFKDKNWY